MSAARPRTIRTALLTAVLLLLGVLLPVSPAQASVLTPAQYSKAVADLINAERAKNGLSAVTVSVAISSVATAWSQTMASTGEFKHNPSYSAQYPAGWTRAAENVAMGWSSVGQYAPTSVHKALMDSSGHRANILEPRTTHVGVGAAFVTRNGRNYAYVTQNFATYPTTTTVAPAPSPTTRTVSRLAGADRFATAVQIGRQAFPTSTEVVLVAGNQNSVVDGLVAAPFARSRKAPVLLSGKDGLGATTAAEITRRAPTTVWLIGGTGVMSKKVTDELTRLGVPSVRRLAGDSRYATAAAVAQRMPASKHAILASGRSANLIDAAAVSGPAARAGHPVLLTDPGALPPATAAVLKERGVTRVTVIGGTGAVSNSVVNTLKQRGITVVRVGGTDRFDTAAKVSTQFVSVTSAQRVVIASGSDANLIDAMTGGTLGSATLLSVGRTPPAVTTQWLASQQVGELIVVGGTGAVPNGAVTNLSQ